MRGHWQRLLIQAGILGSMIVVNFIDQTIYSVAIIISLAILPAITWTVFGILLWTENQAIDLKSDSQSLHDRVDDALSVALASTVGAIVGLLILGRILKLIDVPVGNVVSIGIGYTMVALSLPALGFLKTWREKWFPEILIANGKEE